MKTLNVDMGKLFMQNRSSLFSTVAMNRIFWGALILLLLKIFFDFHEKTDEYTSDYLVATRIQDHKQAQGKGLRFDTQTIIDLMDQYQEVVTANETISDGVDQEKIAKLLENLREERRRFYAYIDIKNRRPSASLSARENRTLRFYLYALDKAIKDLTGEERKRRSY
jgi:hypothetical protein